MTGPAPRESVAAPRGGLLGGLVSLMRLPQWVKNAFVFAPIFFTPKSMNAENIVVVLLVFASFCLVSSGVYCFNDLRDLEADRRHPVKRYRPLPAGQVSRGTALAFSAVLTGAGLVVAILLVPSVATVLLGYIAVNLSYSLGLKRIAIVDVLLISVGFVLRVDAGAAAIEVIPTAWIQICAGLLALFIALAKRRDDLVRELGADHRESLRGYSIQFLDVCVIVTLSALLVSYLIFTVNEGAMSRLGSDKLFLTVPYVLAGLFRYLQLTLVEQRSGSPTELFFNDGFLMASVAAWLATYAYMIHF